MKRNITVNIFGSLYPIDEDAYAMLNSYIVNMRGYFSRQPDGKEIADDIEARVAELMDEMRRSGVQAISIEHIEDIIERIGAPEQMGVEIEDPGQSGPDCKEPEQEPSEQRKLFRDPENRILGGVFAGIGCYFGINPIWLRIAAFLLVWPTYGIVALLYAVCWICIPLADTPAKRLQMKGKPVNVTNLCEEFLNSTREMINRHGKLDLNNNFLNAMKSGFKGLIYAICVLVFAVTLLAVVAILISIVCALAAPWGNLRGILGDDFPFIMVYDSNPGWLIWTCGVSLLILLAITIYLLMHFILHLSGKVSGMSTPLRISCVAVWVFTLIVFSASWTNMISNVGIRHAKPRKSRAEESLARKDRELSYLKRAGWTIERGENVDSRFTDTGEHFSGDRSVRYLNAYGDGGMDMAYTVTRSLKVSPGKYTLKASARANGDGAGIFATNGSGKRLFAPIPVCGQKGGSIWMNAKTALEADSAKTRPDRDYLKGIVKANKGKGYGWSEVVINDVTVGPDSILSYGVTNLSPTGTWQGSWLSATGFELIRDNRN